MKPLTLFQAGTEERDKNTHSFNVSSEGSSQDFKY